MRLEALCSRLEPPEACEWSRPLLSLCEAAGLGREARRADCAASLRAAHHACLQDPPGACAALVAGLEATLELSPGARPALVAACAAARAAAPRDCARLEGALFEAVVERDLMKRAPTDPPLRPPSQPPLGFT